MNSLFLPTTYGMITFSKIRWKNFLSTGNSFTEIDFLKSKSTLIIGTNGAGKSTILDALTFVLFNKPFRKINKPQLVNSTNEKECLVEIEFSVGKKEYKIIRGIKPTVFEIYQNGKMLDQNAAAADQQKHLEQNILKLNFKSFTQIVILGSSTFVPFMQLPAAGRREVIEDILDIKIFSTMNLLVKEKIKMYSDEVRDLQSNAELIREKIEIQDRFISDLNEQSTSRIREKQKDVESLKIKIDIINGNIQKHIFAISDMQEDAEEPEKFETKHSKLSKLMLKLNSKKETLDKEIEFFHANDDCPTCGQGIELEFKTEKIEKNKNLISEVEDAIGQMESDIQTLNSKLDDIRNIQKQIYESSFELKKLQNTKDNLQGNLDYINQEIDKIKNSNANIDREVEKKQQFIGQKQFVDHMIAETKKKKKEHDVVHFLLKDSGVKTRIIKKYLPLMNKLIRQYLTEMDFSINFCLDEEFNETVKSPVHSDFSYASFSEGEKMRIDLALLFTWREIARIKNSVNTNLLILDEIFDSSLDNSGTDDFLKIIRFAIQDANIFVISHKGELLHDKFASVVQFEKVQNFSKKLEVQ